MKKLTNLLHLLLCQKSHENSVETLLQTRAGPTNCSFYVEDSREFPLKAPEHIFWEKIAKDLMVANRIVEPEDCYLLLQDLLKAMRPLMVFLEGNPGVVKTTKRLLERMT